MIPFGKIYDWVLHIQKRALVLSSIVSDLTFILLSTCKTSQTLSAPLKKIRKIKS